MVCGLWLLNIVCGALEAAREHYGRGNHVNNNVVAVFDGYDNIKCKVMKAERHLPNVKHIRATKLIWQNLALFAAFN